jgi:septum site-determining protein MinD
MTTTMLGFSHYRCYYSRIACFLHHYVDTKRFNSTSNSTGVVSRRFILSHPATVDTSSSTHPKVVVKGSSRSSSGETSKDARGRIVCITSGKGGVGKTTTAASFGMGLAQLGFKTCLVDFDIGLRNLDIHLGLERRVIFDFVNVLLGECNLHQALIRHKSSISSVSTASSTIAGGESFLYLLAASQTRDKESLTVEGVEMILDQLSQMFDYVVLDSPAGIESGARHAMYFADDAIIVTNPELSSCRDADKMVGFISSRSRRAEVAGIASSSSSSTDENNSLSAVPSCLPVRQSLLVTRYDPIRVQAEESLSLQDMKELLGLPIVGVIPESKSILTCTNLGQPVISQVEKGDIAALAYSDMVQRYLGQTDLALRFLTPPPEPSLFERLFNFKK